MNKKPKKDDVSREDGEAIRRGIKNGASISILCDLYPSYTKEAILAAAAHNPFRESDKLYEQTIKEQKKMAKRRGYDADTKKAVVTDVLLHGLGVAQTAEKHGVPVSNVGRWVRQAREKQTEFMEYAEAVEQEQIPVKQDAAAEERKFDWQRLEKASAERNEKTLAKIELGALRYDDPERMALEDEIKKAEYQKRKETKKAAVDVNIIKAAAYDVICEQMIRYPCSETDTMMRFIQGVQALAKQLQERLV